MVKITSRKLCYFGLLLLIDGWVRPATAQPQSVTEQMLKQAIMLCMQAQTPMECREALPTCQRILAAMERLPNSPDLDASQGKIVRHMAGCAEGLGQYPEAERYYRQSLQIMQRVHGSEHIAVAESQISLSDALGEQGKYGEAESLSRKALGIRQKLLGVEHADVAQSLYHLAFVLYHQGKYGESETLYRQALGTFQKLLGAEHSEVAKGLNNLAAVLLRQGKYGEAESLFRKALGMRQKLLGVKHLDVATSLSNLAQVLEIQGSHREAEILCREALAMLKDLLGIDHLGVASSLDNLAELLSGQGKYGEVEPLRRKALEIRQKLLGVGHIGVAKSLHRLAIVLSSQGKYGEAEVLLRQSLEMCKKLLGVEHPEVASILNNLANVLSSQAKYTEAETLLRGKLGMKQRLFGTEQQNAVGSFNNLALVLKRQGRYGEAEILYRQALAMSKELYGAGHPNVAITLDNLASVLYTQGKYGEAETLVRQALGMFRKLLGAEHPSVATSLNNLACMLSSQGKYGEAETLYRQALEISTKMLGAEHPSVATSLDNLAQVLYVQGKYGEAETLYRQALEMFQKLLGAEHPDVATNLNNLAQVLHHQGRSSESEMLYRQALWIQNKLYGAQHPDIAAILSNLAWVLISQGKDGEAETLFRQALGMLKKLLGTEHGHIAIGLDNLAYVLHGQGKYREADSLCRQALQIFQKLLGGEHPDVATSLNELGRILLAQGQPAQALSPLLQAARIREGQLRSTVSETRVQAILRSLRHEEDTVYGLLLSGSADAALHQLALTTTLLRKGRAADAGANANRLLHRNLTEPALRQRFSHWQDVRQQRETLLYGGPGALLPSAYRAQLKQLQLEAESLEAQLSTTLPELGKLQPPDFDAIVPAVAKRLPPHGALVEVVWAEPYQAQATGNQARWGAPHYIALLLFPDQRILSTDLGDAAEMDARVRSLLVALQRPDSDPRAAAQALYQQVLVPLLPHLNGVSDLFLSLDGTLNLVPFDALHNGCDYLLGRYRIHYLTSGRDLLREASTQTLGPALVLANPDFGQSNANPAPVGRLNLYQRLAGLSRLPGTRREAELVAPLLGVTPLLDGQAREAAVRASHSPFVLHIATHGLFLSDIDLPPLPDSERGIRGFSLTREGRTKNVSAPDAESLPGEAGAMNRSALALAGVTQGYRAKSPAEDGLLTAQEARSLELEGTQLVILSACETGQGALSAGQGVYGLRRAFLIAGAETVVTSLWRVHDEATGELMGVYYRKLLDKKKPGDRLGAMHEAMQELRASPGRSHPYYWAPFLVIGQDGSLRPPARYPSQLVE